MKKLNKNKSLKSDNKHKINNTFQSDNNTGLLENDLKVKSFHKDKIKKIKLIKYLIIFITIVIFLFFTKSLFIAGFVGFSPITRFEIIKQLEKEAGRNVLDSLVIKKLIQQEAKKKDINITQSEIDKEIDQISSLLKEQNTDINTYLSSINITLEEYRENIKLQKIAEILIADKISVSDDEIKEFYENNKSQFEKNKTYEDLRDQIKKSIMNNKFSQNIQSYLEQLKTEYKIIEFVNY